jgi:hypothetical protein
MGALLHGILDWGGHNPAWAYGLVFVVAMGESLAIVGMAVPGVVLLMGAGALIAFSVTEPTPPENRAPSLDAADARLPRVAPASRSLRLHPECRPAPARSDPWAHGRRRRGFARYRLTWTAR